MQRRRDFYESHPEGKPSSLEMCGEAAYQHLLTPEESVCLTLNYHGSNNTPRWVKRRYDRYYTFNLDILNITLIKMITL